MGPHAFAAEMPAPKTMCVMIDNHRYMLEVADTPELQAKGLQHRTKLHRHQGMIFLFPRTTELTFWMKDCDIPLDILFFNEGRLVGAVDKAPPCHDEECTRYHSPIPANRVVELKGGTRKLHHITTFSRLKPCHPDQEYAP